jgi:hypothetical protein
MSVIVEILKALPRTLSGISKKTGNEYSFKVQEGYLHSAEAYPEKFEFTLKDGENGYQKGMYELADSSVYVDRQGHLALGVQLSTASVSTVATK